MIHFGLIQGKFPLFNKIDIAYRVFVNGGYYRKNSSTGAYKGVKTCPAAMVFKFVSAYLHSARAQQLSNTTIS